MIELPVSVAVSGVCSLNSSTNTVTMTSGTGTCTVTASQAGNDNYKPDSKPASVTAQKATLTVTANDKSRVYGTSNPAFDAVISGYVNGDPASVVRGSASCSTSATTSSAVGTYPISCTVGSLSADNYTFSFVAGTLTITKADNATTTFSATSGGSTLNQAVTYTVTVSSPNGTPSGSVTFYDGSTVLGTTSLVNGSASLSLSSLEAGTHNITAQYSGDANFKGSTSGSPRVQKVSYNVCLLYDPSQAKNSGSTIPVKLQLCDVNNKNVSAANIQLKAIEVDGNPAILNDAGNANPGNFFRFDSGLASNGQGGYIFNLKTPKDMAAGSHNLHFIVNGDTSITYSAPFTIK